MKSRMKKKNTKEKHAENELQIHGLNTKFEKTYYKKVITDF